VSLVPKRPLPSKSPEDDELDVGPFFKYLQSPQGHEVASRILTMFDELKKGTLSQAGGQVRLDKWLQITIVLTVIAASTILAVLEKFSPTIGVLFGTLLGYVFGRRASRGTS